MAYLRLTREFLSRHKAEIIARETCRKIFPAESVIKALVCADEPTRYVIQVFCGQHTDPAIRVPPLATCYIFAVAKDGSGVEHIDGAKYQPVTR